MIRELGALAIVVTLAGSPVALAGLPGPNRSGCGLSPPTVPCQYVFRADGCLDALTASITLRDWFDTPVPGCFAEVTLTPTAGTLALCVCPQNPLVQGFTSDAAGTGSVTWSKLGGSGSLDICVTAQCGGSIPILCKTIQFTAPDLDALGPDLPLCGSGTDLVNAADLAVWAIALSSYRIRSDYDCSGTIGAGDLAVWSGSLDTPCTPSPCP